MKKHFLLIVLLVTSISLYAQDKPATPSKSKFILIIRSKSDLSRYTKQDIETNIKHWQVFMMNLGQSGSIAGGYRPANDGDLIGSDKKVSNVSGGATGELISSFLIIMAANIIEADTIAKQCPVFELGGSIEVRPLMDTAQ